MTWVLVAKTIAANLLTKQVPVWAVVCLLIAMTFAYVMTAFKRTDNTQTLLAQYQAIQTQQQALKVAFSVVQLKIDSSNARSEAYFKSLDTLVGNALQHELEMQFTEPIRYRRKVIHAK